MRLVAKVLGYIVLFVVTMVIMSAILAASEYSTRALSEAVETKTKYYYSHLVSSGVPPEKASQMAKSYHDRLLREYGLSGGYWERFKAILVKTLTLDLGYVSSDDVLSVISATPPVRVLDAVKTAGTATLLLFGVAYAVAALVSIPVGVVSAFSRRLDAAVTAFSLFTFAVPAWLLAILVVFAAAYSGMVPSGYHSVVKYIKHPSPVILNYLALPVTVLAISITGIWVYATKTGAEQLAGEPFVEIAIAKGVSTRRMIFKYMLGGIVSHVAGFVSSTAASTLSLAILVEVVVGWPGIGSLIYSGLSSGDPAVVVAGVYVFTLLYILLRIFLDLLVAALDPRQR